VIGFVEHHARLLCAVRRMLYNRRTREPEISMNKIAIAFLAAMSLASFGCKKKGGAGEAMEMMKKYKTDLCACKDHDMDCGKKATDAYQKAMADWAAKNTGDKAADTSAKPDPEMEKVTNEVADCSKRVMTPDMGAAAGAPPAGGAAAPPAGDNAAAPAGGAAAPPAGDNAAAPAGGAPAAGSDGSAGSGSAAK
jgi:hypothetical protein